MDNTREKLIELLKDTHGNAGWHRWGYEEVADYLISSGVRSEEKQATSDETSKWIPVTERLPEVKGFYLTARKKDVFVEQWNGVWFSQRCHLAQPTNWMPLPEPPKETPEENADRCVCCGEIIPEGRQVCPNCLVTVKKGKDYGRENAE